MPRNPESAVPESSPAAAEKIILRRRMRMLRENQPPDIARKRGRRAQARLADTAYWKNARSVALYAARQDELSVDMLMENAWASGRAVYLPRVRRRESGVMDFVPCGSLAQLVPAAFGLREPPENLPGFGAEETGKTFRPDILVVPGLAFDKQGTRLGFGGGYYDRFLRRLTDFRCVGICFEFQFVESLPAEAWDQPVHYVCTEKRFWKTRP
ncbi:MAG: 5-formyltetrahydrofolate cyclo-ligase [Desulfovibrio sp.]|jgi:5-formyltetrahydrofolate cyclo-ligase|nr:5-formyltetrahydrofolate cyclo-ligase [Desulfovibrio sp.]